MNTNAALVLVEQEYGSVEDFAYSILGDPNLEAALDESLPLSKRAELVGLPMNVFARVIASPDFKALLRADLVNREYTFLAEREHVKVVAGIARNRPRIVMSNRGTIGEVDQAPADVIAAGKYLNELRGTPVESRGGATGGGFTINIHNALGEEPDVQITLDVDASVHQPRRAGELPPPGVLGRRSQTSANSTPALGPSGDDGLGTLYGESAEEADEAHEALRRGASGGARGGSDAAREGTRPQGWSGEE